MNRIILIGRITKDIELKETNSGSKIARFNLAVPRDYKNSEGVYETDFINCMVFGKTAEIVSNYTTKGSQLAIEGRIQTGSYEKDGTKVYTTDVVVDKVNFIGTKSSEQKVEPTDSQIISSVMKDEDPFEISDDDLPF